MKIFIYLIFLFLAECVSGQIPEIQWAKCFGGTSTDRARCIIETTDGGFIAVGSTASNDGDVTDNHGSYDNWIIRFDSVGNIIWQNAFGGSSWDDGTSIIKCYDGNFIIAANTWSEDGDVSFNHGDRDWWVVKISGDGDILWERSYGGSYTEYAYSIQQTFDSGFIICGYAGSNDGDIMGYHGYKDYWIVKTDSIGEIEWQSCLGGTDYEYAYSITQTIDGGYFVCGNSLSDDGDVIGIDPIDNGNIWILKLSETGEIVWQKNFGGTLADYAYSIKSTPDGGSIIAGTTFSINGDVVGNHGSSDMWIIKLNSTGSVLWKKCFGGNGFDGANEIELTSDGGYIIAGYTFSIDGDITEYFGNYDYWIVKIDADGNLLWQKSLGANLSEKCYSIKETIDGGFIVAGETTSNYGEVIGNHGENDYWIVKMAICSPVLFYADLDNDGYGDIGNDTLLCNLPVGYVINNSDCDDTDSLVHPSAFEFCNGIDDDCDFLIDEDTIFIHWFADLDMDTYGNILQDSLSCLFLFGYVMDSTDCDDSNDFVHPAATEICNGIDDNCNVLVDDDPIIMHWFLDVDLDGFGAILYDSLSCFMLTGYVFDSTDCNDLDASINPSGFEICNDMDDDCDILIDEDIMNYTYYQDVDLDGFGNFLVSETNCTGIAPLGFTNNAADCNDANGLINPGQSEICNGVDDNCNLLTDDDLLFGYLFADFDSDGYGNPFNAIYSCFDTVFGYVMNDFDCDDEDFLIYPGAMEILNGIDDNCNDFIDEGLVEINELENKTTFTIFPNPNTGTFNLIFNTPFGATSPNWGQTGPVTSFQIFNALGQQLLSQKINSTNGNINVTISIDNLSSGIYFVRLNIGNNYSEQKLIIE